MVVCVRGRAISYLRHAAFQEAPMIAVAAEGVMVAAFAAVVFKMCSSS